jgi:hypothetical protein
VTWNAAEATITARVDAVTENLPALLAAAGLPPIAPDPSTASGLAIYDSPRVTYIWPCVEIAEVSGPVEHAGASTDTVLEGLVTISFRTADPAGMRALWTGYLTALVACFAGPYKAINVTFAGATPPFRDDATFVQGVAVRVVHELVESA